MGEALIVRKGGKPEEEKTVTAGTSAVTVEATAGKTMKRVTVAPTPTQCKSVTPSTSQQTVTPDTGKFLSSVVVGAVEDVTPEVTAQTGLIDSIKTQLVGKATGANATADKILEGFSAWVNGQLVQGTAKEGIPAVSFDCTKFAVNTFTPTTTIANLTVSHDLGEVPKIAVLWGKDVKYETINYGSGVPLRYRLSIIDSSKRSYESILRLTDKNAEYADYCQNGFKPAKDTIYFAGALHNSVSDGAYFMAGVEYTLITMA